MRSRGGTAVSLPLEGVRVLDLSRLLPGGFCSLLLADFGADVLKVEDTGMGDYIRWSPPYYEGVHESARSALFLSLNRNKRSIRLDLVGLLGLTGEAGGEPVQAAGQIADIGGGALMAAFGIMAALRERDGGGAGSADAGSGTGQVVDVSMADGSLSWLAMVAAAYF